MTDIDAPDAFQRIGKRPASLKRRARMAVVRILHVALAVLDVERSLAFYRDVLGFRLVGRFAFAGAERARALGAAGDAFASALLARDGFRLELLQAAGPAARTDDRGAGRLSHVALVVDDLASTLHSLRDRGVTVLSETAVEHAPGVASCLILDPDGFRVELYQVPAGAASPWDEAGEA
jgi:glyoxylase I family protein